MVAHWGVARVHCSTRWGTSVVGWGCSMVGRRSSMMWWGPSRVHAWWRGPRVWSSPRPLPLGLGGCSSSSCGGCCCLLLHLLPRLHLGVFELLHVEGLTLCEQLLPLKLQLRKER